MHQESETSCKRGLEGVLDVWSMLLKYEVLTQTTQRTKRCIELTEAPVRTWWYCFYGSLRAHSNRLTPCSKTHPQPKGISSWSWQKVLYHSWCVNTLTSYRHDANKYYSRESSSKRKQTVTHSANLSTEFRTRFAETLQTASNPEISEVWRLFSDTAAGSAQLGTK